jgi:hypothetical protein
MNIIPSTPQDQSSGPQPPDYPKKKRGRPPTKKEAENVVKTIVSIQEQNDKENIEKEKLKKELEERKRLSELNEIKIKEAQEKIKRKIREIEKKRLAKKQEEKAISEIEKSYGKIKWKSSKSGYLIQGFYKNKIVFEIKKNLFFSLYIKDKKLMEKHKTEKSYAGCSILLNSLKQKSEKLLLAVL